MFLINLTGVKILFAEKLHSSTFLVVIQTTRPVTNTMESSMIIYHQIVDMCFTHSQPRSDLKLIPVNDAILDRTVRMRKNFDNPEFQRASLINSQNILLDFMGYSLSRSRKGSGGHRFGLNDMR